jgi:hypothetical protein
VTNIDARKRRICDKSHKTHDFDQLSALKAVAYRYENKADRETMLIELIGIKMAATIGDSSALVAKYIPTKL